MDFRREHIKFWIWMQSQRGASASEIHAAMTEVLGDRAYTLSGIWRVIEQFKSGKLTVRDSTRSGRPTSASDEQTVNVLYIL